MDFHKSELSQLNTSRLFKLAMAGLGVALALMASGCGNTIVAPERVKATQTTSTATSSGQGSLFSGNDCVGGAYTCPEKSNVNPNYDFQRDGSGFYTVAYHKEDGTKLHVRGEAHYSNGICIYPMMSNNGRIEPWYDNTSGAAYSQCVRVNDDKGVFVTLPGGIEPNYLIIVEEKFDAMLRNYFATGSYPLMPNEYSRGSIKSAADAE